MVKFDLQMILGISFFVGIGLFLWIGLFTDMDVDYIQTAMIIIFFTSWGVAMFRGILTSNRFKDKWSKPKKHYVKWKCMNSSIQKIQPSPIPISVNGVNIGFGSKVNIHQRWSITPLTSIMMRFF